MKLVEENIDELLPVPEEIIEELVSENTDQTKQKEKTQKIYIDDLELTRILIEESTNRINLSLQDPSAKLPGPSNKLGEWFIKVTDHMLTRGNFRGYSDNYKDEFKSSAYLFFARYWWKFDASKVKQNTDKNGNFKDQQDLKGGFSFFTTLAWTGTLSALKTLKEADEFRKNIAESKTRDTEGDITTDFYLHRYDNGFGGYNI